MHVPASNCYDFFFEAKPFSILPPDGKLNTQSLISNHVSALEWRFFEDQPDVVPTRFAAYEMEAMEWMAASLKVNRSVANSLAKVIESRLLRMGEQARKSGELNLQDFLFLAAQFERMFAEDRFSPRKSISNLALRFVVTPRALSIRDYNDLSPWGIYVHTMSKDSKISCVNKIDPALLILGEAVREKKWMRYGALKRELALRAGLYASFRNWVDHEPDVEVRAQCDRIWFHLVCENAPMVFEPRDILLRLNRLTEFQGFALDRLKRWVLQAKRSTVVFPVDR